MSRKTLVRTGPLCEGGPSPYGPIEEPGDGGLVLPAGFRGRVVARSGSRVAGLTWHAAPDGGAGFPDADGWISVSNPGFWLLGAAARIGFGPPGPVAGAYPSRSGPELNGAGGATPRHTCRW